VDGCCPARAQTLDVQDNRVLTRRCAAAGRNGKQTPSIAGIAPRDRVHLSTASAF
jgi:hypothetical protein